MAKEKGTGFGPGDTVKHKGCEDSMIVLGPPPYDMEKVRCRYYNKISGQFDYADFVPIELVIVKPAERD